MPPRLLKGAARLQEMVDVANPQQAEEDRAKVFMDRLPHVQASSRRLQGQLEIHSAETWPLPCLPNDHNPFIIETNAIKIRAALENCKDFAVRTDRESDKFEFLDIVAKHSKKRVVMQASQGPEIRFTSFEDEKKASETEQSNAIARMMHEGLQEELQDLENEGMSGKSGEALVSDFVDQTSEVPSTPKSLFHSLGLSPALAAPQISQESGTAASEGEDLVSASQGGSSVQGGSSMQEGSSVQEGRSVQQGSSMQEGSSVQEGRSVQQGSSVQGSSVDTATREQREWDELTKDPRFRGIGPYGWPEYDGPPTPEPNEVSNATGSTPEWVYRENATPDPHYDSHGNSIPYSTPTASNEDPEIRTLSHKAESASAASEHISAALAPPSRELRALSVHDSEVGGTQSMTDKETAVVNPQDKGKGRETTPSVGETMSDGARAPDKGKWQETSSSIGGNLPYAPQTQEKGKGKQTMSGFRDFDMDGRKEGHGKMTSLDGKKLDVAASLRNHTLTYLDETQPKAKERNPPVPQPDNMPNTLTEAICNYIPLEAKSILTLTLERVDPPVPSPTDQRCILLKHFEIGLDGVEGLCQGTARIPETLKVAAERERRVGKLGTFKQGDGGFYRSLKSAQQKDQQYGKGYWYFFGVKFKQTSRERKLRRGGKWLLFGAPIEAVYHLDIKRSQENVAVVLGGGVDKSGTWIKPFEANFKRTHTLFSRGGLAPMDIWQGGEDWDDGVFGDIRAAMANNGLRVGFLYGDTRTFTPGPMSFPGAGKAQAVKKRKQCGPDMTEKEMQAMEKSMKPKKLSDEDIGTIIAMRVIKGRDEQDAAAWST